MNTPCPIPSRPPPTARHSRPPPRPASPTTCSTGCGPSPTPRHGSGWAPGPSAGRRRPLWRSCWAAPATTRPPHLRAAATARPGRRQAQLPAGLARGRPPARAHHQRPGRGSRHGHGRGGAAHQRPRDPVPRRQLGAALDGRGPAGPALPGIAAAARPPGLRPCPEARAGRLRGPADRGGRRLSRAAGQPRASSRWPGLCQASCGRDKTGQPPSGVGGEPHDPLLILRRSSALIAGTTS